MCPSQIPENQVVIQVSESRMRCLHVQHKSRILAHNDKATYVSKFDAV